MGLELVQAVFLFALVLLLAWLSTRVVGTRMGGYARGRMIRVLEHVPAGRDRTLLLVEMGGKVYLIGATADRINLLDAISDPEAVARLLEQAPADQNPLGFALPSSFRDVFEKLRSGYRPEAERSTETPAAGQAEAEMDRLQQQLDRLRRLQQK
jgi:flagellar protein FliO/FliZ